jgi:ABC-2 type transport system ATP-binding protein
MVCGLLTRDAGEVTVAGRPMGPDATDAKAAIGLVPQDVALYDDLSAEENLRFFGRLQGLGAKAVTTRVAEALELVGLADRAGDRVSDYSGGMKRRANIAAGLLHRPQLLMLDEPTVGVDPQSRNAILESVERLSTEGMAVLYTTHYMEEAERLCDRVGIIDAGQIKAEGTRSDLVSLVGGNDRIRLDATGDLGGAAAALGALFSVVESTASEGGIDLLVRGAAHALPEVIGVASGAGASVVSVAVEEPNLEAVFLHLTGKALRD